MLRTCASSTCSLPSALRARSAKMSRMRLVRSTTRHSSARSRFRCCAPESGWLKMTRSAPVPTRSAAISSTLPLPGERRGVGALAAAGDRSQDRRARGDRERVELGHPLDGIGVAEIERDEQRAIAALRAFKHAGSGRRRRRTRSRPHVAGAAATAHGGRGTVKLRRRAMGRGAASRPTAPGRRSRSRACTPSGSRCS